MSLPWSFSLEVHKGSDDLLYTYRVAEWPAITGSGHDVTDAHDHVRAALSAAIICFLQSGTPIPEPVIRRPDLSTF